MAGFPIGTFEGAQEFMGLCALAGFSDDDVARIIEWPPAHVDKMAKGSAPFVGGFSGEIRRITKALGDAGMPTDPNELWRLFDSDQARQKERR